jgi:hypothetical protein
MRYVTATALLIETALQALAIDFFVRAYRDGVPEVGALWLAIGCLFEAAALVLGLAWLLTVVIRWRLRLIRH